MGNLENMRPFPKFFYTLGMLPTSFKISLTYEEQMEEIMKFIRDEIIPHVNANTDAILQLTTYVHDYFDNLDVQEEINNKLDQMVEDGTLTEIIGSYVDPKFEQFTNEVNTEITDFENTTNNRLQNQDDEISDFENRVNNKLDIQDTTIDLINNKVDTVASGSPAGVYATVSALTEADPDHTKIYLVTADGNWYYYSTNTWVSGGQYLASPNDDKITILDNEIKELQNKKPLGRLVKNKLTSSSGGQISITNNNNFSYIEINMADVTPNVLNKIKATFKMSQYLYFINYTNGTTIIGQDKLHTSEQPDEQVTEYELTIPDNCTNIYINGANSGILNATITVLDDTKEAIAEVKTYKKYKSIVSRYYQGYFSASGGKATLNNSVNYLSAVANVSQHDKLKLSFFASQWTYYIFLTDSEDNIIVQDFLNTQNQIQLAQDYEYTIPNLKNISKIYINSRANYPCEIRRLEYADSILSKNINCWGDSLTDGSGSTDGNGYTSYLQSLLGNTYQVNNYGIAGEKTEQIGRRKGTYQLYLDPVNINSNDEIPVTIKDYKLDAITDLFMRGGVISDNNYILGKYAINPVKIGNIVAMIKQYANGNYTLQKISGDNVNITRPTKINTIGSSIVNNKVDVYWCGSNDLSTTDSQEVIDMLKAMMETNASKNYIVIGMTNNNEHRSEYNALLQKNFGVHFIDIYKYLITYGLQDENITPTTQDEEDIANGYVPSSLTNPDHIHFNDYGYEVIANQVYKKGQELKYW